MKATVVLVLAAAWAMAAAAQQAPFAKCAGSSSTEASAPSRLIVGRWKHVELSRYSGPTRLSTTPFQGENVVRFDCEGTWALAGPNFQSSGTYRWLAPDQLEQKIVESNIAAQRGQVSVKRIVVDGKTLELHAEITAADVARGGTPARVMKPQDSVTVVSRFERLAAP